MIQAWQELIHVMASTRMVGVLAGYATPSFPCLRPRNKGAECDEHLQEAETEDTHGGFGYRRFRVEDMGVDTGGYRKIRGMKWRKKRG